MASSMLPIGEWRAEAIARFDRRDFDSALVYLDQCLSAAPEDKVLLNYKARALDALGRFGDSLACIDRCLEIEPGDSAEWGNRAVILTKLSRPAEALDSLDRQLAISPNHGEGLVKKAHMLHQMGRREAALNSADLAVRTRPQDLSARNMRGMLLDDLGRHDEALADFEAILALDPNYADAITNRGIAHGRRGEFADALACYERSLTQNPNQLNAVYNRAVVRLVLGDWKRGFQEFESRWKIFPHEAARLTRLAPLWTGQQDIKGKTVLLHHEQGYGDTLQFCRYVPLVAQRGARVLVATPAGLQKIVKTLPGSPHIFSEGEAIPAHDFHCPLMSLPWVFGTTPENAPADIPYLHADPKTVSLWAERLGPAARVRIGLVWSGRRFPPINHARDMALESVLPLFALNAEFVSLHTELSDHERQLLSRYANVRVLQEPLTDFADTAGLVMNLELIIAVDSAVAHLAGALGKPVWVMNRYASCWRWMLQRTDSPWYPTLRLFRQPKLGDWDSVVSEILQYAPSFIGRFARRFPARSSAREEPKAWLALLQAALDLHHGGDIPRAIQTYRQVLAVQPGQPDALHYLGVALAQAHQYEEALAALQEARLAQPANAALENHCGNAFAGLRDFSNALECYERAIALDPSLADAYYNRGATLAELGRRVDALEAYARALELNPSNAAAYNNRGNLLAEAGENHQALADYARALELRPDFVDALINQSHLQRRLHDYAEAQLSAERAIKYGPTHPGGHNCLGAVQADLGLVDAAMASYERALTHDQLYAEALWNKGLMKLTQGELLEGFELYETRWQVKSLKLVKHPSAAPKWRGTEALNGKTILVCAEQGYGDTLQCSRYCSLLGVLGARVILAAPSALRSLLSTVSGIHQIVGSSDSPSCDFQCSLMSLPHLLRTELGSIPAQSPYLRAESSRVEMYREKLSHFPQRLKAGLVWAGRATHTNDFNRSMSFRLMASILREDIAWVSLQKPVRDEEVPVLAAAGVSNLSETLDDFAATAALIENLDLVIAVDTAVAHLAGALGKPVWTLLPYAADWRWLRSRSDSPWYPSMRLFRQPIARDWPSVMTEVKGALAEWVDTERPARKSKPGKRRGATRDTREQRERH